MKAYASLCIGLVLSTVAAGAGLAAAGPPPKRADAPSSSAKAVVAHGSHASPGEGPKTGGRPGAAGNGQAQPPGGGKGTWGINGTGVGAQHSASVNGTGMGAQHNASIGGTAPRARH